MTFIITGVKKTGNQSNKLHSKLHSLIEDNGGIIIEEFPHITELAQYPIEQRTPYGRSPQPRGSSF